MEQIEPQQDQPSMLYPRIESDPQILNGKPIIQGSRLTVETILENMASGYTLEDLLDAYPFLTPEDITAAIEYAARLAALPPGAINAQERIAS